MHAHTLLSHGHQIINMWAQYSNAWPHIIIVFTQYWVHTITIRVDWLLIDSLSRNTVYVMQSVIQLRPNGENWLHTPWCRQISMVALRAQLKTQTSYIMFFFFFWWKSSSSCDLISWSDGTKPTLADTGTVTGSNFIFLPVHLQSQPAIHQPQPPLSPGPEGTRGRGPSQASRAKPSFVFSPLTLGLLLLVSAVVLKLPQCWGFNCGEVTGSPQCSRRAEIKTRSWTCPQRLVLWAAVLWLCGCEKLFCWRSSGIEPTDNAPSMGGGRKKKGGWSCSTCLLICAHWEEETLTDTMPGAGRQAADGSSSPPHITACSSFDCDMQAAPLRWSFKINQWIWRWSCMNVRSEWRNIDFSVRKLIKHHIKHKL